MKFKNATSETLTLPFNDLELASGEQFELDTVNDLAVSEAKEMQKAKLLDRIWEPEDLVISEVVGDVEDITQIDFTILGFRKQSPSYDKGRKVASRYWHDEKAGNVAEDGLLVVEKIFSDIKDEDGNLIGIAINFNWYQRDGEVGVSKVETAVTFNKYAAATEMRKRRGRQIDYLVAGAIGTPLEPYVNLIFDHYYEEALKYREKGTSEFAEAINSETNQQIVQLLGIEVAPDKYPGYTLKHSLLAQIM